jgi:hypothetical protein
MQKTAHDEAAWKSEGGGASGKGERGERGGGGIGDVQFTGGELIAAMQMAPHDEAKVGNKREGLQKGIETGDTQ